MAARLTTYVVVAIVAATLIAGLFVGAQRDDNSGPIDLIIHNARVYVADDLGTMAEAVAIRGNKILRVGGEREIMRLKQPQTTVIDAKGAAVLPGFNDAHVSLIAGGLAHDTVQLFGARTLEEIQQRVGAWAQERPDSLWVTGAGWSYDTFTELPTRAELDAAVPDRPVALLSQDAHALWLNSSALKAARITKNTPNPKNGTIVRDRRGEATGLLKEGAMALVERAMPKPAREERARALQQAIRDAQQRGITSVQDMGTASGDLELFDAARDSGALTLRVYASVPAMRTPPDDLAAIAKRYPDDPVLKTGVAEISLDGAVDAQTAAMLAPYSPRGSGQGAASMTVAELSRLVATLDEGGWQVAIDAAGDRAVRQALDAFGAAGTKAAAGRAPRPRVENVEMIDPDDLPRFGALGVVASMQPLHATADGLGVWEKNVGPDRALFGWAARSLSAAGAHLAFGTDWPALPLDPLAGLRAAVARVTTADPAAEPTGDDASPAPHAAEQLTLKSAINAWTSGPAWASFDDRRKGTLKPGMLADLVVLSTDIFGGPAKLAAAQVDLTIFDGKVVYRRRAM